MVGQAWRPGSRPGRARRRRAGAGTASARRYLLVALAAAIPAAAALAGPGQAGTAQAAGSTIPARSQPGHPDRPPRVARALTGGAVTAPGGARAATAGRARTVVSFTFDDGDADQLAGARILQRYRLRATYYIITGAVGTPGYLTLAQLRRLAAGGNEIGAHTVSHLELTGISAPEARRQACLSRAVLTGWGLRATSFAYPGGAASPRAEAIVRGCGFGSARLITGLRSGICPRCTVAGTVPPARPMAVRTPGQVDESWTLAELGDTVRRAERSGGGWLPLVFHHVCSARPCGPLSVTATLLGGFARWLAGRAAQGTVVRTVSEVAGGGGRPVPRVPPAAPHQMVNPSLEAAGPSGVVNPELESAAGGPLVPRCWMRGGYGSNTVRWQRTTGAQAGRWAERITITAYRSGDAKLLPQFDTGQCSLPVRPGRSYQLSAWYRSSATTQFSVYYRAAPGRWVYWTSGPYLPPAGHWARATWATPPVPAGAQGLSFGLALFHRGWLVTDGYGFRPAPANVARQVADGVVAAGLAAGLALLVARWARRRRQARAAGKLARPDGNRAASSSRP